MHMTVLYDSNTGLSVLVDFCPHNACIYLFVDILLILFTLLFIILFVSTSSFNVCQKAVNLTKVIYLISNIILSWMILLYSFVL